MTAPRWASAVSGSSPGAGFPGGGFQVESKTRFGLPVCGASTPLTPSRSIPASRCVAVGDIRAVGDPAVVVECVRSFVTDSGNVCAGGDRALCPESPALIGPGVKWRRIIRRVDHRIWICINLIGRRLRLVVRDVFAPEHRPVCGIDDHVIRIDRSQISTRHAGTATPGSVGKYIFSAVVAQSPFRRQFSDPSKRHAFESVRSTSNS